jgi:hypothetical protein
MLRWGVLVLGAGLLPAFILRCDKAALNFQRSLYQGLGDDLATVIIDQLTGQTNPE